MKKVIKWVVIVVVLVVIVAVATVIMNLDGIIRRTVETQANSQLQVPTTLDGVHLSILGGSLSMNDLKIGSPKGFTAPQMLALGKADVQVSYNDLRGDPVRVGTISLEKPKMVIEQSGMNLNFKALMDQLPKGETPPPDKTAPESKPLKLIIDQINIKGAEVQLLTSIPGGNISFTIPDIEMKNVGSGEGAENGAALKDVVMLVVTGIASKASESEKIPAELRALLKGNLGAVADQLKGRAEELVREQLGNVTERLGEGAGNAVGDVLKGKSPTTQDLGDAAGDLFKNLGKKKDK